MRYILARRAQDASPPATTALAIAAATLAPGQCRLFGTIPQSVIQNGGENAPMTKYGSSAYWDPIRREVGFIGKRDSSGFPYHWLVYPESTDTWSSSRAVWSGGEVNQNGHGYDHNTCDPATGVVYHRPYNDSTVRYWDGSWHSLAAMPSPTPEIAGFLAWFPALGLVYGDRRTIRKHPGASNPGASWTTIEDRGVISFAYHGVGEYNANLNALIWGAGNADDNLRMINASQVISAVPTPPFNCGSSELQGLLTADPRSNGFIIWEKATTNWAYWKPGDVSWTTLTQSTGSGAAPQNGMPNLSTATAGRHTVVAPIDDYDITMWVQAGSTTADVWIHKHNA